MDLKVGNKFENARTSLFWFAIRYMFMFVCVLRERERYSICMWVRVQMKPELLYQAQAQFQKSWPKLR